MSREGLRPEKRPDGMSLGSWSCERNEQLPPEMCLIHLAFTSIQLTVDFSDLLFLLLWHRRHKYTTIRSAFLRC